MSVARWQDSHHQTALMLVPMEVVQRFGARPPGRCLRRKRGGISPPRGEEAMSERLTARDARRMRAAEARAAAKRVVPTGRDLPPEKLAGLYDPRNEHDSCGVGFIADLKGGRSHDIIEKGLQILENLTHRGAVGADPLVGDGAGMLIQIPHEFLAGGMRLARLRAARARRVRRRLLLHAARRRRGVALRGDRRAASSPKRDRGSSAGAACRPTIPACRKSPTIKASEPFIGRSSSGAASTTEAGRRLRAAALHPPQGDLERHPSRRRRASTAASTSSRCRRGPSSTRACSSPTSSAPITRTCTTRASPRRWRWCISASPPTRFRRGSSRIPTGWSRITARSTRCAAT